MKSIMQDSRECYLCRQEAEMSGYAESIPREYLEEHHIFFGTANKKLSEKYGLKAWLCPPHHRSSNKGVHHNILLNLKLKQEAQAKFEEIHTRQEFMEIFGKSWII